MDLFPIIPETIDITDDDIEIDVNPSSPISEDSSSDEDDDDGDVSPCLVMTWLFVDAYK